MANFHLLTYFLTTLYNTYSLTYFLIHCEFSPHSSDPDQEGVEGHAQDQDHHPWIENDPDQGGLPFFLQNIAFTLCGDSVKSNSSFFANGILNAPLLLVVNAKVSLQKRCYVIPVMDGSLYIRIG